MAPGYVIAACFEGAGAIGIVLGLRLLHAEQRAKAAELARFLRSGQVPDAAWPKVRPATVGRPASPIRFRTPPPPAGLSVPSDALLALRSAYEASAR